MLLIEHRVNTIEKLATVPPHYGIEVDIRDYDGALRMEHDPFLGGQRLEDLLQAYRHALIIFNVKCDGLEEPIMELATKYDINNYFFLDVAPPTLIRLGRRGIREAAVRYSEYEPIESALALAGKVDWVWVDCFTQLPLDPASYQQLKRHFKICLVSPELQKFPRETIQDYRRQLQEMPIDAVCSDFCADWKS
jgi:hypothetical protein